MPTVNTKKSKTTSAPAPAIIVSSDAESSFKVMRPRFAAIPRDLLVTVNIDIQAAAMVALGVSRFVADPAVRARFAKLAKSGEYDDTCVDDLPKVAQAAWYARHRFLLASATEGGTRVSAELLEEATAQRSRMLKLADYWLGDDAAVAAELAAIRPGNGYQDLANDLIALASLFERNAKALAHDKKLYQASDGTTANRLAGTILERLSATSLQEQSQWSAMQPRAWTLLLKTYEEVRRGGLFLFADDQGDGRFPSLIAVSRAAASRPAKEKENGASAAPADSAASTPEG